VVHLNKIELWSNKLIPFRLEIANEISQCKNFEKYVFLIILAESRECDDLDRSLLGYWYQKEDTDD